MLLPTLISCERTVLERSLWKPWVAAVVTAAHCCKQGSVPMEESAYFPERTLVWKTQMLQRSSGNPQGSGMTQQVNSLAAHTWMPECESPAPRLKARCAHVYL